MAVPFSCKTRVCPSCINRRAEVLSHSLAEKLPEGDYRHLVVTLPKKVGLRKRFQLDTGLHRQIGRLIHRVLTRWMAPQGFSDSGSVKVTYLLIQFSDAGCRLGLSKGAVHNE